MSESPIEFTGLTKFYGDIKGIDDLTFEVAEGEIFGFLGPNGAGKSTAIRSLLGLLHPTAGGASILGHDVTDRSELLAVKESIGYIPDERAFYRSISGGELLDYLGELKGADRRGELLDRFPIPEARPIKEYSSGNKQKLAIVQAFMHNPAVAVMDEPTAGLDPLVQNEFYELLAEEQAGGTTCFFSSHILSEVRRVCDRVGIIRDGELVALEEIDTLLAKSGKVVEVRLGESPPVDALEFPGVAESTRHDDGYYTLLVSENFDGLVATLREYSIIDISIREASLEDVFMHFYEDEPEEGTVDV